MPCAPVPRLPHWLARATSTVFGTVAAVRHSRGLHPRGATFDGEAVVHAAGAVLAPTGPAEVVVRLSRGIGLPHPWPDFNGVAIRFLDAHGPDRHQDVLLTSSFSAPIARRAIYPWPTFDHLGFSSVLSFDTDDGPRLLRVEPLGAPTIESIETCLPVTADLQIAGRRGPWSPAATVTLRTVLSPDEAAEVRFDPWTTSGAFRPRGLLNRLRAPAYAGSRKAVPRTD